MFTFPTKASWHVEGLPSCLKKSNCMKPGLGQDSTILLLIQSPNKPSNRHTVVALLSDWTETAFLLVNRGETWQLRARNNGCGGFILHTACAKSPLRGGTETRPAPFCAEAWATEDACSEAQSSHSVTYSITASCDHLAPNYRLARFNHQHLFCLAGLHRFLTHGWMWAGETKCTKDVVPSSTDSVMSSQSQTEDTGF